MVETRPARAAFGCGQWACQVAGAAEHVQPSDGRGRVRRRARSGLTEIVCLKGLMDRALRLRGALIDPQARRRGRPPRCARGRTTAYDRGPRHDTGVNPVKQLVGDHGHDQGCCSQRDGLAAACVQCTGAVGRSGQPDSRFAAFGPLLEGLRQAPCVQTPKRTCAPAHIAHDVFFPMWWGFPQLCSRDGRAHSASHRRAATRLHAPRRIFLSPKWRFCV